MGIMVRLRDDTDKCTAVDVEYGFHLPPNWLKDVKLIVDLGANIGLTMIDYCKKFPEAKVIGAELDRGNWELAVENLTAYKQATVYNIGIAIWDGWCRYDSPATNMHNIVQAEDSDKGQSCLTLDSFLDFANLSGKTIDFMKFDIEGMERSLFESSINAQWIKQVRCLSVETHYEYEPLECLRDIAALGFETEMVTMKGPNIEHCIEFGFKREWIG